VVVAIEIVAERRRQPEGGEKCVYCEDAEAVSKPGARWPPPPSHGKLMSNRLFIYTKHIYFIITHLVMKYVSLFIDTTSDIS
jgi:hypothetical protein